jgi:hypothetical protein
MGEGLAPLSAGIPFWHFMIALGVLSKFKAVKDSYLHKNDGMFRQ